MSDEWIVTMPKLGETVTEGTVGGWRKQVGDSVEFDDPLFEVSTDKVDSEIPSPYDGVILEILVPEGETVPVGTPLVRIGAPGSTPPRGNGGPPARVAGGGGGAGGGPRPRPPRGGVGGDPPPRPCPGRPAAVVRRSTIRRRPRWAARKPCRPSRTPTSVSPPARCTRSRCRSSVRPSPRAPSADGASRSATVSSS